MQAPRRILASLIGLMLVLISLAACAQAVPTISPTSAPTPTPAVENRLVQLEWPAWMRLGESDVITLALIPSVDGYNLTAEFPEHQIETQTVPVPRPDGYFLIAAARLDGVGFHISPEGLQEQYLPAGRSIAWSWSISPKAAGQQRLAVSLRLRWQPADEPEQVLQETVVYNRGMDVQVSSILGLSRSQVMTGGFFGLIFGGGLSLVAFFSRSGELPAKILQQSANPGLKVEPQPGLALSDTEQSLLQAIFHRYDRLVIEKEFLSGYSGARTFLALPIRNDGRSDAHTIVKIGEQHAIQQEYQNYEQYVKDRLPPITARIQHPPVTVSRASTERPKTDLTNLPARAALRYTFIEAPGSSPVSLRESLLNGPDPELLVKLFDTFGPNWWMQRHPYTFRLAQEYDSMLPPHLVVKPISSQHARRLRPSIKIDERITPERVTSEPGDLIQVGKFSTCELRADQSSQTLIGKAESGQPALRIRWLGLGLPGMGEIVATRHTLLAELAAGFGTYGLPDPLSHLPELLSEVVQGTRSTIHGDLNLENILVGPGDFVWLIDFAHTREGHTLLDIAHLRTELIANILAPRYNSVQAYLQLLNTSETTLDKGPAQLLVKLDEIAERFLFNPADTREYHLACFMSYIGALKYKNLADYPKQLLYLTAASLKLTMG